MAVTLYATVRNAGGQYYNGAAFENFTLANWANYAIAMAETPAGGYLYLGNFPALAAGNYQVDVYQRAGAAAAVGDTILAGGSYNWSGTAEICLDASVSSRLASASYTVPDNADIAAIKAKTDNLPASPAAVGAAMTLTGAYDAAKTAAGQGSVDALADAVDSAAAAAQSVDGKLPADTAAKLAHLNADMTAVKLAADGLDSIFTAAPAGVAANFREMIVQLWRRFFGKSTLTASAGAGSGTLKTFADDGVTTLTTQALSEDAGTQTVGEAE